jgi:succinate dehydrogenase / fumarate reductase, cytochrome b subunit
MQAPAERPLSPHLQVHRMLITMVLSMMHRVSGLYLSLCSLLFVAWVAAIAAGPSAYEFAGSIFSSLALRLVLAAALAAFWYHLFAGFRHIAWDADLGFEGSAPKWSGVLVALLAAGAFAATVFLSPAGRWLLGAS